MYGAKMPRQENKKQYLFNSVVYFVYKNFNGNFIILHRYKFAICANFDIFYISLLDTSSQDCFFPCAICNFTDNHI